MQKPHFTTALARTNARLHGFAASGPIDCVDIANSVFKTNVPGSWLACYMLRRFGWPNIGGDPYKDLCNWLLTTPMPGLFLEVRPYLGENNHHFALRFTRKIEKPLRDDPGRESYLKRVDKTVRQWWGRIGCKRYTIGIGNKDDKEDTLIHTFNTHDNKVYGLWKRTKKHTWSNRIPKNDSYFAWAMHTFLKEKHPEFKWPEMTKQEKTHRPTRFQLQVRTALRATMRDLLRPTHIRDTRFNPFGNIDHDEKAIKQYANQHGILAKDAGTFDKAGNTPKFLYGRKKSKKPKPGKSRRPAN